MTNARLRAALEYAARGWAVFPLSGKRPYPGTHGHLDATTDRRAIRRWWKEHPDANVGVRCDSASGPIVIDVDGPSGRDFLRSLETRFGPLPETLEATSGRPHRKHLYFAPDGRALPRTLKIGGARLDVLGDGGYVVAPPSVHPKTGKPYRWLNHRRPKRLPQVIRNVVNHRGRRGPAPPLPEEIVEGARNDLLTSLAGSARRRGASEEGILALLREENERRCRPPLRDRELQTIARSIGQKRPVPVDFGEPLNDINLARRFAQLERDALRFCPPWRRWLVWDGTRWARDDTAEASRRVEAMVRGLFEMAQTVGDLDLRERLFKDLNRYTQRRKLDDVLHRASVREELVVMPDVLDADPWLLNVENGTLDLRRGQLRPHDPKDRLTKLAPVEFDPRATCPRWNGFLSFVTQSDHELEAYLQRAAGYTMVGVADEHVLFFGHGSGANGKTTFLETLYVLFGDYAVTIDFETLLYHRYQTSSERDLPRLHKARFVLADEAPTNARWDERAIKKLTGGNTLSGRWLYQEKFDFEPTHTLWCQANDKPSSYDPSEAFWRRMRLVPFAVKIPDAQQIKGYKTQLLEELSGVLNWALAGCLDWQRAVKRSSNNTLAEPPSVRESTRAYREETDVMSEFFDARCERGPKRWAATTDLYREFVTWWRDARGQSSVMTRHAFTNALEKADGLSPRKRYQTRGWQGVGLREEFKT